MKTCDRSLDEECLLAEGLVMVLSWCEMVSESRAPIDEDVVLMKMVMIGM